MAGPFFSNVPKFQWPLSSRGGGGLGLHGPAINRRTFFAASQSITIKKLQNILNRKR